MANTPKGAKAPQDHQPKSEKPKVEKIDITLGEGDEARTVSGRRVTLQGIEVSVPDEALDDFELLDDIRAVQDQSDPSRMPSLLRRIIVPGEYRAVLDALRGPNGRVSVEDGSKFVLELFRSLNPS